MYFFESEKTGFGIALEKRCGMRDAREKDAGIQDQDPPFQTLKHLFDCTC